MEDRFSRNIGVITTEEQVRLNESKVFVAGCGGIGGYVIEHLVRMGVGHIVCADHGYFEHGNLNRQILSDMTVLGRAKAACAHERAVRIRPEANVRGINIHIDETNITSLIHGCDLVIDALDNIKTRRILFAACKVKGISVIYGAVREWLLQVAFVPPEGQLYNLLYPENICVNVYEEPISVMSFAPSMAASIQAALSVRYLCGQFCDDKLHIYNMQTMEYMQVQPSEINNPNNH